MNDKSPAQRVVDKWNQIEKEEEDKSLNLFKEAETHIKTEGERIRSLSTEDFVQWLLELHYNYIEFINYTYEQDWLNSTNMMSRMLSANYVKELMILFTKYEIDELPEGVIEILIEKTEVELIAILNVLNYL